LYQIWFIWFKSGTKINQIRYQTRIAATNGFTKPNLGKNLASTKSGLPDYFGR